VSRAAITVRTRHRVVLSGLALALGMAATTVRAADAADAADGNAGVAGSSSLARALPSDSLLLVSWSSPEGGFAERHLSRLRRALVQGDFLDRYLREHQSTLDAEARRGFEAQAERWKKVLAAVDWWRLLSREAVVGARPSVDGRLGFVGLFRVGEADREPTIAALRDILYAIAGSGENLELDVGSRAGVSAVVLYDRADYGEQLAVSGAGDVVAIASSASLMRQAFQLLEARGRDTGMVHEARYLDSSRRLFDDTAANTGASASAESVEGRLEVWVDPRAVFRSFPLLDVVDSYHLVATATRDEIRCVSRWELTDRTDSPLHQALSSQPSARDLLARVPAAASSFSVDSGSRPTALYDAFLELAVTVTGDAELAERIERDLQSRSIRLRADVFGNASGRRATLGFAGAANGRGKRTWLFEVLDVAKARATLATFAREGSATLASWNVGVSVDPGVVVELDVALLGERVWLGVAGEFIVIATAREAFDAAAQAVVAGGAGSAPGRTLPWLPAEGDLDSVSETTGGADAFATFSGALRVVGLAGTLLPDDGGGGVLKPFCVAAPRLQRAVESLGFLRETRAWSRRDGRQFRAWSVTKLAAIESF